MIEILTEKGNNYNCYCIIFYNNDLLELKICVNEKYSEDIDILLKRIKKEELKCYRNEENKLKEIVANVIGEFIKNGECIEFDNNLTLDEIIFYYKKFEIKYIDNNGYVHNYVVK